VPDTNKVLTCAFVAIVFLQGCDIVLDGLGRKSIGQFQSLVANRFGGDSLDCGTYRSDSGVFSTSHPVIACLYTSYLNDQRAYGYLIQRFRQMQKYLDLMVLSVGRG